MGRREDDARPPIEILGADPGISSTQQVAVGAERHPHRRRRWAVVAAVVVVVALVSGALLGGTGDEAGTAAEEERDDEDRTDGEDPETSTTERRTTTTRPSTTTTIPLGPPLGEPVEGALLLFGAGPVAQVVDLASGGVREVDLPSTDPYAAVPVAGGVVISPGDGTATYYRILGAGAELEPRPLGRADLVLPATGDRVWLVDLPPEGVADEAPRSETRLVDLQGRVHRSFQVPGRWVERATDAAVLISRGGRVFAVDERGLRSIAVGWTIGTSGDAAVVLSCDESATCALRRQPIEGSAGRLLLEVADPDGYGYEAVSARDGRLALYAVGPVRSGQGLLLFDSDGSPLGQAEVDSFASAPQWLPGDRGLVVSTAAGIEWIHREAGSWVSTPILDRLFDPMILVITP